MKLIALFLAIIVMTSLLVESTASGVGGIYGQEQRNHVTKGKVIEGSEKEKLNTNNPKSSVESANNHAMPKVNNNNGDGTSHEDGKLKHRIVHA